MRLLAVKEIGENEILATAALYCSAGCAFTAKPRGLRRSRNTDLPVPWRGRELVRNAAAGPAHHYRNTGHLLPVRRSSGGALACQEHLPSGPSAEVCGKCLGNFRPLDRLAAAHHYHPGDLLFLGLPTAHPVADRKDRLQLAGT